MMHRYSLAQTGASVLFDPDALSVTLDEAYPQPVGFVSAEAPEHIALSAAQSAGSPNRTQASLLAASGGAITHIALFVSQECNLRCVYCYGDGGTYGAAGLMPVGVATRSVDWLISQTESKNLGISFFGGEPLLNLPVIKHVVDYARTRAGQVGKDFEFGITTNGTLLDDERIAFLRDNAIAPVVSLDGTMDIHNKQRPFVSGEGSYARAVRNAVRLLAAIPTTTCRATLVDGTDLADVEAALQRIGFRRIQIAIASPSLFRPRSAEVGRPVGGLVEALESLSKTVSNALRQRDAARLATIKLSGLGWHLMRMLEQLVNRRKRYFSCGAGRSSVAVSTDGWLYLCHRFVGQDQYRLGNVNGGRLSLDRYQVSPAKGNARCVACRAKFLCGGGCYHDNLAMTGSIFTPSRDLCRLMRSLADHAVLLRSSLAEEDVDFMSAQGIIDHPTCPLDLY